MMDFGTTTAQPSNSSNGGVFLTSADSEIDTTTTIQKSNSPFFTASNMLPHLQNQEFFNAIESRYNLAGPFATTPSSSTTTDHNMTTPTLMIKKPKFSLLPQQIPIRGIKFHQQQQQQYALKNMSAYTSTQVLSLLLNDPSKKTLFVDVRSFVKYSQCHIQSSINIAVPNTILRRTTFNLEKVSGVIVSDRDRQIWEKAILDNESNIIFYDEQSELIHTNDNSAIYYLYLKFDQIGYQGRLGFIQGGMSAFSKLHPDHCISGNESIKIPSAHPQASPTVPPTPGLSGLPPVVVGSSNIGSKRLKKRPIEGLHLGSLPTSTMTPSAAAPFANDAFNPFFSNIRQNMELCHGSIKERFPVRFPNHIEYKADTGRICFLKTSESNQQVTMKCYGSTTENSLPLWIQRVVNPEHGPKYIAETYEIIERTEQKRLQNVMAHHSSVSDNLTDHPFSIVAGIEKGTLNRYTNVWPFEYTRVKLQKRNPTSNDYINASFIQYIDFDTVKISTPSLNSLNEVPRILGLNEQNKNCLSGRQHRKYISTQGPLPTTFNDFWEVVWEQNSRVIVMLTKEEEMHRIKCHRYWPSEVNKPEIFGSISVTLVSETIQPSKSITGNGEASPNLDETLIFRQFELDCNGQTRTLQHFQYEGWQDFGVPNDPLGILQLVSLVDGEQTKYESMFDDVGPMIVHCSAGCGRTGAFCTIDTLISRLKDTKHYTNEERMGELDLLFQTVSKFREQRVSMVQTLRQYVFCYEAILWWILGCE